MRKISQNFLLIVFALVMISPMNSFAGLVSPYPAEKETVKVEQKEQLKFSTTITTSEVEQFLGRKMTGMEKLAFKINKKKLVKALNGPQAMSSERTNTWAIVGFVCSLLIAPLGIIFSAIALSQINRTGEGGRGLALAGLIIGIIFTIWIILSLAGA
jgi:hypothetical protein